MEIINKNYFICIINWLDSKIPFLSLIKNHFIYYPIPIRINFMYTFGAVLIFAILIQILSGITLSIHYIPDIRHAFNSINKLMRNLNYGWLVRYIHINGASLIFLFMYFHVFRGLYYKSYKDPRELVWIIGSLIFILIIIISFMGYILSWGQMSYWATTVITNIVNSIPLIGKSMYIYMLGSYSIDNPTIGRFFILHCILPFFLLILITIHLISIHFAKQKCPSGKKLIFKFQYISIYPLILLKDLFSIIIYVFILSIFVFIFPEFFNNNLNYYIANPLKTPKHIVPEWYFLPFYSILRIFNSKLLGIFIIILFCLLIFFIPWIDVFKNESYIPELYHKIVTFILGFSLIILGWTGLKPINNNYLLVSKICIIFYFLYFAFLSILNYIIIVLIKFKKKIKHFINEIFIYRNLIDTYYGTKKK